MIFIIKERGESPFLWTPYGWWSVLSMAVWGQHVVSGLPTGCEWDGCVLGRQSWVLTSVTARQPLPSHTRPSPTSVHSRRGLLHCDRSLPASVTHHIKTCRMSSQSAKGSKLRHVVSMTWSFHYKTLRTLKTCRESTDQCQRHHCPSTVHGCQRVVIQLFLVPTLCLKKCTNFVTV